LAFRSKVDVEIIWDQLPWIEGVLECAAQGILPGGIERNKESCGQSVIPGKNVSEIMADICYDPQTSGGLLIAISPEKSDNFLDKLHAAGQEHAAIIGTVRSKGTGKIRLETTGSKQLPSESTPIEPSGSVPDIPDSVPSQGLDAYTKRAIRIAMAVSKKSESNLQSEIEKALSMGYTQSEIDEVIEIAKQL